MPQPPLIVIVGPTAVGKTSIAIKLAPKISGEIISADSMQIYKDLNIGTAKVTTAEMEGVPHYLLSIKELWESFSVAEFQSLAKEKILDIHQRDKKPILVGGTGLYINSIISQRYNFIPTGQVGEIRQRYQKMAQRYGPDYIHQQLSQVDPVSAQKIHPNDLKRTIRALEVYQITGKPISSFTGVKRKSKYDLTIVGLHMERQKLYERINHRVDLMLEKGWLQEVQDVLKKGIAADTLALQGLGYKQLIRYLNQEISYDSAVELIKRDTRRYAKRQITWFKRDQRINWLDITNQRQDEIVLAVLSILSRRTKMNVE